MSVQLVDCLSNSSAVGRVHWNVGMAAPLGNMTYNGIRARESEPLLRFDD